MRFLTTAALVLAVAGCNSSSGIDALNNVSSETVSSIRPMADIPGLQDAETVDQALTALSGETPEGGAHAYPFDGEARVQLASLTRPNNPASRGIHPPQFGDTKPVKFKGASPHPFQVHGVDVSKYQGNIDWATLRGRGASFAFIKATEGDDHKDEAFRRNWLGAAQAGIPRGAYHFYYWCSTAKAQAKWFISNVPKEQGALPPVIDVEWNAHSRTCPDRPGRSHILHEMKTFMDIIERHYGQKPIIYTSPDFYSDNLQGRFTDHSFWLRSVAAHPNQVYPDRDWAFWQYSGTGLSDGVDGNIDLNVFNGTAESWRRWVGMRTR